MAELGDEKNNRPLPHQSRRPRLTAVEKTSQKNQVTEMKALQTKGATFRADTEIVIIRHVAVGLLPCVTTTSLRPDAYMEENVSSDTLRLMRSPAKSQTKVVRKDQFANCNPSLTAWHGPMISREISRAGKQKRGAVTQKFQILAWIIINSRRKNLNQLKNYQKVCSQTVLKCFYLARIGRPDLLWSVNKLARRVTKWTQACDRRLARLVSDIHHTDNVVVRSTVQHCRLGLFQDSDLSAVQSWKKVKRISKYFQGPEKLV